MTRLCLYAPALALLILAGVVALGGGLGVIALLVMAAAVALHVRAERTDLDDRRSR